MKKILTLLMLISCTTAFAQRFDAALWGGINACQIDGDQSGNYNHFGIHAAINTTFSINSDEDSPLRLMVELGFAQKGAYEPNAGRKVNLNYIELPLMLTYRLGESFRLGAGIAPGLLVSSHAYYPNGEEDLPTSNNYRKLDALPIVADLTYRHNHLLFSVRYENSMLPVSIEAASGTYRIFRSNMGQFSRLLTAGIGYQF